MCGSRAGIITVNGPVGVLKVVLEKPGSDGFQVSTRGPLLVFVHVKAIPPSIDIIVPRTEVPVVFLRYFPVNSLQAHVR